MRGRERDDKGSDGRLQSNATTQTKGQNVNKDQKAMAQSLINSSTRMESERGGSQS